MTTKIEENDIKRKRYLPPISDKAWNGVNNERKAVKLTWDKLFKRVSNYPDWFFHLLNLPEEPTLGDQLNALTVHNYIQLWLSNMYINFFEDALKDIHDINEIFGTGNGKPAIVIGAGPSLWKYKHLELLADSDFYQKRQGVIITTSHTLRDCLEANVVPDYMILLDPEPIMIEHLNFDIIDQYADQITAIFAITTYPDVLNRWHGKKIFFMASISDMTIPNMQAVISGFFPMMTEMNALGNAGTFGWNIARVMGCSPIALIGMDEGFLIETPVEETPYYKSFMQSGVYKTKEECTEKCYHFHTHSFFKTKAYTDDVYMNFANNQVAAAKRAKELEGIITLNCTEGGIIDEPDVIENMYLRIFLQRYD